MKSRNLQAVLDDLPPICALTCLETSQVILVKKGETGYWPAPVWLQPDEWNAEQGITPEQVEAMRFGSLFGFHVPGADPLNHLQS